MAEASRQRRTFQHVVGRSRNNPSDAAIHHGAICICCDLGSGVVSCLISCWDASGVDECSQCWLTEAVPQCRPEDEGHIGLADEIAAVIASLAW